MEFFCYHRDRPDSPAVRQQLAEAHWAYMDRYSAEVIGWYGHSKNYSSSKKTGLIAGISAVSPRRRTASSDRRPIAGWTAWLQLARHVTNRALGASNDAAPLTELRGGSCVIAG